MELFLTVAITHFIALLTPGVDFFLILKTVIQGQKKSAQWVCLGIASGNAFILLVIYLSLSVFGKFNTNLLDYIKYLGSVYLLYMAFQCFGALRRHHAFEQADNHFNDAMSQNSQLKNYSLGLFSSLLNPKNILFYSTLIILIYSRYGFIQNLMVCIWMVVVVLLWNLGIVKLLSRNTYTYWLQKNIRYLYGLSGICFSVFAIILLF